MDEYHRYYDFRLGDENVGYFEIRLTDGELFRDWGGAASALKDGLEEAKKGSPL